MATVFSVIICGRCCLANKEELIDWLEAEIEVYREECTNRQYKDSWSDWDWKAENHAQSTMNKLYGWVKWLKSL